MQQSHLELTRSRQPYPWELNDETRRVGKQGLARARAILDAKRQGPAQQELKLHFGPSPTVAKLPPPTPAPKRYAHPTLAA